MATERPKIAVDARALAENYTSNRTYWQEMLAALAISNEVEVVLFADQELKLKPPLDQLSQVVVKAASSRLWSLLAFPEAARKHGADLAHVQYSVSPLFKIPVVTTIHDISYFIEPKWFSRKDRFILRRSVPMAIRKAKTVIAVSETSKREMVDLLGASSDNIVVTPLGVPAYIQRKDKRESIKLVQSWSPVRGPYILSVGTLQPRKNWPLVFRSLALARKELGVNVELVVTGPNREAPVVSKLIEELGASDWIHLVGGVPQERLSDFYSGAEALVHPSLHEGFGLTPLEAFACGTPVVASNRGAIPEVAEGVAILLDPQDPQKWAEAIQQALDPQKAEAMRKLGIDRAKQYTWAKCAELTESAYRRTLD